MKAASDSLTFTGWCELPIVRLVAYSTVLNTASDATAPVSARADAVKAAVASVHVMSRMIEDAKFVSDGEAQMYDLEGLLLDASCKAVTGIARGGRFLVAHDRFQVTTAAVAKLAAGCTVSRALTIVESPHVDPGFALVHVRVSAVLATLLLTGSHAAVSHGSFPRRPCCVATA